MALGAGFELSNGCAPDAITDAGTDDNTDADAAAEREAMVAGTGREAFAVVGLVAEDAGFADAAAAAADTSAREAAVGVAKPSALLLEVDDDESACFGFAFACLVFFCAEYGCCFGCCCGGCC